MHLVAFSVMKALALVAAAMTVTTGQPLVGCVCPDGRVKLFCTGPTTRCCCSTPLPSDPAKLSCCGTTNQTRGCCVRSKSSKPSKPLEPPKSSPSLKGHGCERTVLADGIVFASEGEENVGVTGTVAAAPCSGFFSTTRPFTSRWSVIKERHLLTPPPNLIISLCHFTC